MGLVCNKLACAYKVLIIISNDRIFEELLAKKMTPLPSLELVNC